MPNPKRRIRTLEDTLARIRYQTDILLAEGVGLNSLTDLFKQIDAVEAEISRLRESGAPRRRSKSRTSRDNRRDQQPNDGMVAAIVSKWFRGRNRALGKRVLGVCRSTPALHVGEYEPRQIVLAGLLSVMGVADVASALSLDLSVPDDLVPILVRMASEYAAQDATRKEPVSVDEVLELAQVISALPNQAQLDDIAWLSAIVFWRADWWDEVGDIVETARLAIHLNVHGTIDLVGGPKLEKLRVLESIFSVERPVLLEDTEVLALASVEVLNFILARRLHERGLECMTSFASAVRDLQASIDLIGLAADMDDSLKDVDPCWLVPFAGRHGMDKAREVFARLTSSEGQPVRRLSRWGLLRPVGCVDGELTPAELELLFSASLEARQARLFINEPGLPLSRREILDVATLACSSQADDGRRPARIVPDVGIVVTDWSLALRLVGTTGPEYRIPRDARIRGYAQALTRSGAGFLAEIAKDFTTRIVQSILVSGIKQGSAERLTNVICRHDDIRFNLFSRVEEAIFMKGPRLGKVLLTCPEIITAASDEVLAKILKFTCGIDGSWAHRDKMEGYIESIMSDRVRTVTRHGTTAVAAEIESTLDILQKAVGYFDLHSEEAGELALEFLRNHAKRSSENWGKVKRIVASWLLLYEAEGQSDAIASSGVDTLVAKLDALTDADPFVTYSHVMTPDRIERWKRGIKPLKACKLPLGFKTEVLVDGEKMVGEFLLPDDKRGVVLGEITHCCQSPGAAGDLAAWFGHEDPRAGYFVVTNAYGFILGMSMVWVDVQTNTVVFDNIEHNRFYGDDDKAIALSIPVYNQTARVLHEQFGFRRVLCGVEYSTWAPGKWHPADLPIPKPICSYSDARDQVDLLRPKS